MTGKFFATRNNTTSAERFAIKAVGSARLKKHGAVRRKGCEYGAYKGKDTKVYTIKQGALGPNQGLLEWQVRWTSSSDTERNLTYGIR